MVWNTPGKGGDSPDTRQNPWPPRRPDRGNGGGGLDGLMDQLRGFFGGNGGGLGRWILLGVALLVLLSSFQLFLIDCRRLIYFLHFIRTARQRIRRGSHRCRQACKFFFLFRCHWIIAKTAANFAWCNNSEIDVNLIDLCLL